MNLNIVNLGKMEYTKALDIQKKLQQKRIDGEIDDTFLLVEHYPVLTMGLRGKDNNVLVAQSILDEAGIKTVWIKRGGDVTYHGPGQMVGYPIINITQSKFGVKAFVNNIQETFVSFLLEEYGIIATKQSGVHTGVWVDNKKVTAIGIAINKSVSMHGFAFNINTNLMHFDYINPCGLGYGMVTSLQKIVGHEIDFDKACKKVVESFCRAFDAKPRFMSLEELL